MTPFIILLACLLLPLAYIIFIFLVRNPEIPLAVQANGTVIYFYLMFKIGLVPNILFTGGFYGALALAYLSGGLLAALPRKDKICLGTIDIAFLSFLFLTPLSTLIFSAHNPIAWRKLSYLPLLALAPYLGTCLLGTAERLKSFLTASAVIPGLLLIPSFYELSLNPIFRVNPQPGSLRVETDRFSLYRFEGFQSNPILLSVTISVLILVSTVWLFEQKSVLKKWRLWAIAYLMVLVPSLFLVLRIGSRGALLSLGLALSVYLFFLSRWKLRTKMIILAGILVLGFILYSFMPGVISNFYEYTFTADAKTSPGSSIFWRLTFFRNAFSEFRQHPLFGVGFGNSVGGKGYPHNILLEAAAEMGIIGLSLFAAVCILAVKKARDIIKSEASSDLARLMKIAFVLFLFSLTEAMVSSQLESNTLLYVSIGLISFVDKIHSEDRHG
jgi:O-antigen ligase